MKQPYRKSRSFFDLSHMNVKKYKKVDIVIDNKTCHKYKFCKVNDNKYSYVDFTVVNGSLSLYKIYDDNIIVSKGDITNKVKTNYVVNHTGVKIDDCEKTYFIFINDEVIGLIKINILKNKLKLKSLPEYQWLSSTQYIISEYIYNACMIDSNNINPKNKNNPSFSNPCIDNDTLCSSLSDIIISSGIASSSDYNIIKDIYLTSDNNICDDNLHKLNVSLYESF